MKKVFAKLIFLPALAGLLLSCGPSAEERRQQEIQDSIQLEEDRRNLLDRANHMLEGEDENGDEKAETAIENNTE